MIKPYRLINSFEMGQLNQHFTQVIRSWSNEYARTPLIMNLAPPPDNYSINNGLHILTEKDPLAIIEKHYIGIFNQILFGENEPCFNSVSQELMYILLYQLFKVEHCVIEEVVQPSPNWFYRGSTCLILTLSINQNNVTIILNPDWVYQCLSPNETLKNNLCPLDEALAEQTLALNLELLPLNISIKQLLNIQAGDVIVTEHPITTPLRLTRNNQVLAQTELGQSSHYKSILLKRFS
ncbi:FliM/FliN family flagellar motor C-terminal domain-containing protein [Legionella maioricensis]|uniref:FliM/FliN family flagellar motor C-terminal domain-containing protein n=1 Tax=Legionella maioricensis TaxID=2896528 RepID=A0A9X2I8V8_9GAMM|nr:FliM/FliN family flagellar motor C-terminal domain-containing protein [Legionella maioricensis]MCL9682640.1 FliM/FliN family flagellar motor C-terminal domain-containing protein [Legionella maioricensis]MCL9687313.1 FliM/FliN family flagellar motor C-terminal domain-containing protein [Legionella maioricensis]